MAELAEARCQHLGAGIEAIAERRFPASRAGGWKEEGRAGNGFKNRLQSIEAGASELRKLGRPVIF
jgi:hypothetical protein